MNIRLSYRNDSDDNEGIDQIWAIIISKLWINNNTVSIPDAIYRLPILSSVVLKQQQKKW